MFAGVGVCLTGFVRSIQIEIERLKKNNKKLVKQLSEHLFFSYGGVRELINDNDFQRKTVESVFVVTAGNIVKLNEKGIAVDAIVNAAKPTLMGGGGVDGAVHEKVDSLLQNETSGETGKTLNKIIKEHFHEAEDSPDDKIRCLPGHVVMTEGCEGLAKYIIHAVGAQYDGGSECMRLLKQCYEEAMQEVFNTSDIKSVAIPVIGSGNYNCPFDLALRIAISSICNCLIEEKKRNYDNFSRLEKVYLVVYDEKYSAETDKIYHRFEKLIKDEQRMIYSKPWEKQKAYCVEIFKYDTEKRNYFTVTKMFRFFLAAVRFLFPLSMLLKSKAGKKGWKRRREMVEAESVMQMLCPIFSISIIMLVQHISPGWWDNKQWILVMFCVVTAYFIVDMITGLLALIFLTDIYGPSANPFRTIILLIVNYIQVLFGITLFYYVYHWRDITFWQALDYGVLGKMLGEETMTMTLRAIQYTKTGMDFLFMVLTFAFFVSHLRHREFLQN